jgi:hypothetical protein
MIERSASVQAYGVTKQMHAAVLHSLGETPRYERFPSPVAGEDDVVTVTASDETARKQAEGDRRMVFVP